MAEPLGQPPTPDYDDDTDDDDPYLAELLNVLDRVETEGEPYLEKLILQAGLQFSSPSDSDPVSRHVNKISPGKKVLRKKRPGEKKSDRTKVSVTVPASDEDYRKLYGTYNEGARKMSPDESWSSQSSTSTESLVQSLGERIARGEPLVLDEKPLNTLGSYGAKIIPYVSFNVNNQDASVTKHTQSDVIFHAAEVSSNAELDDEGERLRRKKDESECAEDSSSDTFSLVDFEEDLYDEGKSQEVRGNKEGPEMVLLSSSEDGDELEPPQQYYEYTQQESQCLTIVSNFRRQFTDAYQERKQLFLTPVNEVGVPRFVCSTIRPTIFSFEDLFHWDGIARFFSYQMEYILLSPPDVPPSVVMSPSLVLKERQGNSFDYSFILASVLIGVGYDAYIVNGYATLAICTGDESHRICPLLTQDTEPEQIPSFEEDFDLSDLQSSVAEELLKPTIKRQRDQKIKERNECVKGLEYLIEKEGIRTGLPPHDAESQSKEEEELDPYKEQRVHAWILILPGRRDVTQPFFIEPLTGRAFALNHDEFLGVEAIWNHRQYYVNMQQPKLGEDVLWDLSDSQKWQAIFSGHVSAKTGKSPDELCADSDNMLGGDGSNLIEDEGAKESQSKCGPGWPFLKFELPKPWSEPLRISKKSHLRYCKNGYRLHRFQKCDMEYYHPYERADGLVTKFILFQNRRKTRINSVKEVYANRKDRLKYRKYLVCEGVLREYFSPGHSKALKMHQVKMTGDNPPKFSQLYKALNRFKVQKNVARTLTYYSEYRNDCLKKVEQHPENVSWYYEGRRDRLIFRRINYGTQIDRSYAVEALKCKGEQRPVALLSEKFERNLNEPDSDCDIYIREFDVRENKLYLVYQPADGMVMSTQRRFHLPDFNEGPQKGSELPSGFLRMSDDVMLAIFRDQLTEEKRLPIDIWDEMLTNYRLSLEAIVRVRRAEDDLKDEVNQRIEEERDPVLWHSTYDVERHPRAAAILKKAQQAIVSQRSARPEKAVFDAASFDWVAPYMAAYGGQKILSLNDALAIRQTVLKDLRERLLYTANALQKAHEDEFSRLQVLNEKFRKRQEGGEISPEDLSVYQKEKGSMQFRMHMLERRQELLQFEAPAKLKSLNEWMLKDPRFAQWLDGLQLETRENVIVDELMSVKEKDTDWTPAQRKKVWKLESEDGHIVVEPLDKATVDPYDDYSQVGIASAPSN